MNKGVYYSEAWSFTEMALTLESQLISSQIIIVTQSLKKQINACHYRHK